MLYGHWHISQLALIERRFWPTVLESCIVGTTEDMDGFLQTLGRVIRIPTFKGEKLRESTKHGMTPEIWAAIYEQLTPLLQEEIALWRTATSVAHAQHLAARMFTKLITDGDDEVSRTGHRLASTYPEI